MATGISACSWPSGVLRRGGGSSAAELQRCFLLSAPVVAIQAGEVVALQSWAFRARPCRRQPRGVEHACRGAGASLLQEEQGATGVLHVAWRICGRLAPQGIHERIVEQEEARLCAASSRLDQLRQAGAAQRGQLLCAEVAGGREGWGAGTVRKRGGPRGRQAKITAAQRSAGRRQAAAWVAGQAHRLPRLLTVHVLKPNGTAQVCGHAGEGHHGRGVHARDALPPPLLVGLQHIQAPPRQHARQLRGAAGGKGAWGGACACARQQASWVLPSQLEAGSTGSSGSWAGQAKMDGFQVPSTTTQPPTRTSNLSRSLMLGALRSSRSVSTTLLCSLPSGPSRSLATCAQGSAEQRSSGVPALIRPLGTSGH